MSRPEQLLCLRQLTKSEASDWSTALNTGFSLVKIQLSFTMWVACVHVARFRKFIFVWLRGTITLYPLCPNEIECLHCKCFIDCNEYWFISGTDDLCLQEKSLSPGFCLPVIFQLVPSKMVVGKWNGRCLTLNN